MQLRIATEDDVLMVAREMREDDFREFIALSTEDSRDGLALQLGQRFGTREDVIVADYGGWPVAIGGLIEARPRVASLLFFATENFPAVGKALTKFIRQSLFPSVKDNVHRIEAVAMVEHTEAHRWIQSLGLAPEGGPMRGFGKGGEAYQTFAWVRDDL